MALELRECLGGVGVERGQTVKRQFIALGLRQRLGGIGVERGQAVEPQAQAFKLRERLGGIGVERGQAAEIQMSAFELRHKLLCLLWRQVLDFVRAVRHPRQELGQNVGQRIRGLYGGPHGNTRRKAGGKDSRR